METLKIERVALESLHTDPANARSHNERNLDVIRGSLARFGQRKPIVVDRRGRILAGNGTYDAARALGWQEIDIVRTDLEGLEATAYAIADNRSAELAVVGSSAKVADKSQGSTSGPSKVVFGDRLNIPLIGQPKPGTEPESDRTRQSSSKSKSERVPVRKPEPEPPTYQGLTVMSWVLRVMAVGSFVGSYKLMLATKRHGFSFWEAVMVLVVGVAISAAIWAGGDALEALRDIARNRHRD